jgi:hypothetical protein
VTIVFAVVGVHRHDPCRLLLLGADGRYYGQALPDGQPVEVEPDEAWLIDRRRPAAEEIAV